jgi:outer membrane immunogenic protein
MSQLRWNCVGYQGIKLRVNLVSGGAIMKRVAIGVLAGLAAVTGFAYGASAADLAVKAAPPPAPVLPSWTGFYLGVHAGAAWQSTPNWTFTDPNLLLATTSVSSGSAQLGAVGGIQGGYNWQFAPAWVAGIEGDISWASLSDHRTNNPLAIASIPATGNSVSMSANTQWLSSVRGKLGFVGWNTLWYLTGGGAWANVEYSATSFVGPGGILNSVTSFNTTKSGWVVGGGAEWMATTNILLRAEYLYYGIDTAANGAASVSPPARIWPLPLNYSWARDNVQVFRIAGSYKF